MFRMVVNLMSLCISCVLFYKAVANGSLKSLPLAFMFFLVTEIHAILMMDFLRLLIPVGVLILTLIIASIVSSNNVKRETKEKIEAQKREREAEIEVMKSGNWEFPALSFFQECSDNSVSPMKSDDFSKQKVRLIAQSYYVNAGLPKEYWEIYNEKLTHYYRMGQEEAEAIIKENNEKLKIPTEGTLSLEDIILYYVGTEAKELSGIEKRKFHLDALITQRQSVIDFYVNMLKEAGAWGTTTVNSEKSWVPSAVIGGLVGGTAGAVLNGINAMERNEHRRKIDASFNETSLWLRNQGDEVSRKIQPHIDSAIKVRDILKNELEECEKKVVVIPEETLKENITLTDLKVEKTEGNTLKLSLKIRMNGDMPNDRMRLDGIIHTQIYNGDIFVDDIYVPLPVYGLLPNTNYTIYGACKKSIASKTGYTAKICELLNFSFVERMTNACIEDNEFYTKIPVGP